MKTKLILALCLCAGMTHAQELLRTVIGSAGTHYEDADRKISWTVGETFVETIANSGSVLTQGFHQPESALPVSVDEALAEAYGIEVFPNPVMDYLNIKVNSTKPIRVTLSNALGQHLWQRNVNDTWQVSTATLNEQVYFLHCYTDAGEWIGTYKILRQ